MKLSENTLATLKNFAIIYNAIVFEPGNTQRVIDPNKRAFAEAEFDESFDIPSKFGMYDLNRFINNVQLMNDPEIVFTNETCVLTNETTQMTFHAHSPDTIVEAQDQKLKMSALLKHDPLARFEISNENFQKIIKMASINSFPFLTFSSEKSNVFIKAHDKADTSNFAKFKMGEYDGTEFKVKCRVERLRFIPDAYTVSVYPVGLHFQNSAGKRHYYIALEL